MPPIRKSGNFNDIPTYDKEYWWAKTPQERLAAELKLIQRAKAIYYSNPTNPPLGNGGQVLKSSTHIEHQMVHYHFARPPGFRELIRSVRIE